MGDGYNDQLALVLSVDHLKWVTSHEVEAVPIIAIRESLRIGRDGFQGTFKLHCKTRGGTLATFGIPAK